MERTPFIPAQCDVFGGLDVDEKSIGATFISHEGLLKPLSPPLDPLTANRSAVQEVESSN